ncbi:uncharacterized protein STEHIDRAFT_124056 [Stereum hirsutum FP-91666 SS1]|uniref:uncharacterized protein n=1 Tax=Stereum hirsutum (strain FP-91666) TaxID=721885 RepID=UPI000444A092|nr:uncharacterized protein STEHIDRAFT_124056 [Stereum hirsutum FP-91666 SS1]EIM82686.1 hypothetical protein STEHIDRAFT_124056 [Stereum hirsutum FP-91666 SS1]
MYSGKTDSVQGISTRELRAGEFRIVFNGMNDPSPRVQTRSVLSGPKLTPRS